MAAKPKYHAYNRQVSFSAMEMENFKLWLTPVGGDHYFYKIVRIDFWGHFVNIPIKKNIKKTSKRLDLIRITSLTYDV